MFANQQLIWQDGTAEPVSRDQILRHARGQGNIHFPCSADHIIGNLTRLIHTLLYVMTIHTYIYMATNALNARNKNNNNNALRQRSTDFSWKYEEFRKFPNCCIKLCIPY